MPTIVITPAQFAVLTWVLPAMQEFAESEDSGYTFEDLPLVRDENKLDFLTDNREVVGDLVYRLENNADETEKRETERLANTIRRAHGMYAPDVKRYVGPTVAELAMLGAHPDLVRKGIFKGVDFNPLARRLWALESMRAEGPLPKIRWRALSHGGWSGGRSFVGRGRIIVSMGPGCAIERAAETLLHELVHMVCPRGESHGEVFRRRLIACAREAFGLQLDTAALLALGPGKFSKRAYAIDEAIVEAMIARRVGKKIRESDAFSPPPVETEEEIAAGRVASGAARVAAREARARDKLAEWEKRLAAARRIASKWRTKVRYYERRQEAAKRGAK